jgi:tetratricopeptide (TPR) repeat protein
VSWLSYYLFWMIAPTVTALISQHPIFLVAIAVAFFARNRLPDPYLFLRHLRRLQRLKSEVGLNPSNAAAHRELATIYLARHRPRLARPHIEAALRRGDSPELQYLLGLAALGEKRWTDAQAAFEACARLDPKFRYGDPQLRAGDACAALGQLDEARAAWEQALEVNSSSVEAQYKLSELHRRMGEVAESRRLRGEALATYRQLPPFLRRQHFGWYARAQLRSWLA